MAHHVVDVLILGGGVGGLSAALYASRARLKTLVLDKQMTGGQIATTELVENYPGIRGTTGPALAQIMRDQADEFGAQIMEFATITRMNLHDKFKTVVCTDMADETHHIEAKTVILAMGATYRKLGVPGEAEFYGKGVSNCATCDGKFFEGKTVAVVGGGNTALEEGHFLTRYADIDLIHRKDTFRAEKIVQERMLASDKVDYHLNKVVEEIHGEGEGYQRKVTGVTIRDLNNGSRERLDVDGVFVFVGMLPNTTLVRNQVYLDEQGYIPTNDKCEVRQHQGCLALGMGFGISDETTELTHPILKGVYAIGDVRKTFLRQAITSAADGAIAAVAAEKYIEELAF